MKGDSTQEIAADAQLDVTEIFTRYTRPFGEPSL
jgi:hypothetical protein